MNTPCLLIVVDKPSQYAKDGYGRDTEQWNDWLCYLRERAGIATLCEMNKSLPESAVLLPLPSALTKAIRFLNLKEVLDLKPKILYMDSTVHVC